MYKLTMAIYHRKRHDQPIISLSEKNAFIDYKSIINKFYFSLVIFVFVLLFLTMFSNNTFVILLTLILSVIALIKIFKLLSNMKNFFRIEFELDYILINLLATNEFPENAFLTYFEKDNGYLEIVALKTSDMSLNSRLEKLDSGLESSLGLPLISKTINPKEIRFLLGNEKPIEQWHFKPNDISSELFNNIPLDIVPLSNSIKFSLSKSSMLGLFGRTGSGKTVALQWYLYLAIAKGTGTDPNSFLTIIDGKGADLQALGELAKNNLRGNVSVGSSPTLLAKLSREFVEKMNSRYETIQEQSSLNADAYELGMTPNFLFIDELASIKDECGTSKEGKALWNEILGYLGLIAKKGRQAACHLVLSTQDPNAENIPSEIRSQITSVLFLGSPSADRLRMAFSMCDLENIPSVPDSKGGGLFYADGLGLNEPIPVIAPFVDVKTKSDFVDIINRITPEKNNFI